MTTHRRQNYIPGGRLLPKKLLGPRKAIDYTTSGPNTLVVHDDDAAPYDSSHRFFSNQPDSYGDIEFSFSGTPLISPISVTPSTSPISVIPSWVWVVLSITGAITVFMVVNNMYWLIKKGRDHDQEREDQEGESSIEHQIEVSILGPKKYQLKELKSATNNFSAQNEIGRGGFGVVYKGTLRGKAVAVKRTSRNDQQGRKNMIAEVTTIGSLHHKNLVKLFGWCCKSNELLLVYEYMPNVSLDNHLYGNQTTLSWERRHNIVRGVAHSIDYLHNGCSRRVLHRDIKTSNILLDSDFNACLGDFGLARMIELSENTQEIAGTRAYMAPEIFLTGKATTQTDVYAFGVLALEVACGKRPRVQSRYSIVEWVWELYKQGMIYSVVDPKLNEIYDKDEAECVLLIGLACCHPDPRMRPSVRSALQALMGEILPPSVPLEKPDFVWPSSAPLSIEPDDHLISGGILSSLSLYAR